MKREPISFKSRPQKKITHKTMKPLVELRPKLEDIRVEVHRGLKVCDDPQAVRKILLKIKELL